MKLSVCIVNYNVCNELQHCLQSVQTEIQNIDTEVFVIDNHSTDNSCSMIQEQFPWVKLIANKENLGFAKANNQAIRQSTGEYILILNPDTIILKDTFQKAIDFMDTHKDCGGLGGKMFDKDGNYLPESKRGIPTPFVAFCKFSGLYKLFPQSDFFNHYYLGSLSKDEPHEVEILAGACMFLRKSTLDKIGLLDEQYFLYGEDIDISYRIIQNGYKNYYVPNIQITHYKGVSTRQAKKQSQYAFYDSMKIFVKQHFTKNYNPFFIWCIVQCINLRTLFLKRYSQPNL